MVRNCIVLFLKCRLGSYGVLHHRLVVAKHIRWAVDFNAPHTKLVPQAFDHFNCGLHHNKIQTKRQRFGGALSIWVPEYQCMIDVNNHACMKSSRHLASCMVCIDKTWGGDSFATHFWYIWRYLLITAGIKLSPITRLESRLFRDRLWIVK